MEKASPFLIFLIAWIVGAAASEESVATTQEFRAAFLNQEVTTIYLHDTLKVNVTEWTSTVAVNRSLLLSASPVRLASRTYVELDFSDLQMMYSVSPGNSITFRGLQMKNFLDKVGPIIVGIRQSVGATVINEDCIQRRWVGLPYNATVVNMRAAPRPDNATQNVTLLEGPFSYNCTSSPNGQPLVFPGTILEEDYRTQVAPDSSLASQGLYYGGYTFISTNSHYVLDHVVSGACLARSTGVECITLMRAELQREAEEGAGAGPGPGPAGQQQGVAASHGGPNVALIVPLCVVLPTAAAAAALLGVWAWRSRRQQAAGKAAQEHLVQGQGGTNGDLEHGAGGRQGGEARGAARGRLGVAGYGARGDGGCVFMGLDDGQTPPEWSEALLREDEEATREELRSQPQADGHAEPQPFTAVVVPAQALALGPEGPTAAASAAADGAAVPSAAPAPATGSPAASALCVCSTQHPAAAAIAPPGPAGGPSPSSDPAGRAGSGEDTAAVAAAAAEDARAAAAEATMARLAEKLLTSAQATGGQLVLRSALIAGPVPAAVAAAVAGAAAPEQPAGCTSGDGDAPNAGEDDAAAAAAKVAAAPGEGCAEGAGGGSAPSSGRGRGSAAAGAGPAALGPALLAELEGMARSLRGTVGDVAIRLECVVGSGAFGTVFKGTWQGLPVAVKTVVFSATDDRKRRALQEAALCQSICHPNIVATYLCDFEPLGSLLATSSTATSASPAHNTTPTVGSTNMGASGNATAPSDSRRRMPRIMDWRLYLVQEFCDGGPLRNLYGSRYVWRADGSVDMACVLPLALGISRALSHLHAKRIVHGDLNPNNVLLARDAASPCGWATKVADFGLSVMLPAQRTHVSNLRMGTMFYICPRVILKAQVAASADIFSLGVMLWELYHGRTAGTRSDTGPRYRPTFPAFPPACPPPYATLARACLQRDPAYRPTAEEVTWKLEEQLQELYGRQAMEGAYGQAVGHDGPPGLP